jgi:transcriptional regulator with XRE-family HTH domain
MTNYDAQSAAEDAEIHAGYARHQEAIDFEVDELMEPTDPVKDATHGQLGETGDMERLASYNLRRIRLALGLSQQQIADKLAEKPDRVRLSQSQIAKMERGDRPWRVNEMYDIAAALGIDPSEFFGGQLQSDSVDLQMLAARLKYQAAWDAAERVEEDYRAAVRKALEAGLKLVHTAAVLGVKDATVLHILANQAERAKEVQTIVSELQTPPGEWPGRISIEESRKRAGEYEERTKRRMEQAEQEWERLVDQVAEKQRQADDQ